MPRLRRPGRRRRPAPRAAAAAVRGILALRAAPDQPDAAVHRESRPGFGPRAHSRLPEFEAGSAGGVKHSATQVAVLHPGIPADIEADPSGPPLLTGTLPARRLAQMMSRTIASILVCIGIILVRPTAGADYQPVTWTNLVNATVTGTVLQKT